MTRARSTGRPSQDASRRELEMSDMEVKSINDFDREPLDERDHVLHSAVDQLVALTQPEGYWPTLKDLLYHFGTLDLDAESPVQRFDFSLPSSCPQWPGPRFSGFSLHKVVAKPVPQAQAQSSRRDGHITSRIALASKGRTERSRNKPSRTIPPQKPSALMNCCTPPLRLIQLPPEIRNLVWHILAKRQEPLEAQLRQIRSCRKLTPHRRTFVRRFPREPRMASVNKQLRQEVLSIFYGVNCFVFERNNCSMFAQHGMLSVPNMLKWKPQANLAAFLTAVDIKFNALPRTTDMVQIVFQLRRQSDGTTTVGVSVEQTVGRKKKKKRAAEVDAYCLCDESDLAMAVLDATTCDRDRNLVDCATDLVQKRCDKLFSGLTVTGKTGNYFPPSSTCERCAKPTFERVYSGV